jgi:hypothetical protein
MAQVRTHTDFPTGHVKLGHVLSCFIDVLNFDIGSAGGGTILEENDTVVIPRSDTKKECNQF